MIIINIILIICWLVMIFILSNQDGNKSYGLSNKVLVKGCNVKDNNVKDVISKYSILVRKLAHVFLYFILAILIINLLNILNIKYKILITIISCFIYACSDEFHQYFIPGRTATFRDVVIDTVGSILGIVIYMVVVCLRSLV